MSIKRFLALIITAPIWLTFYIVFVIVIQLVVETIHYGWTGKWEWDWKL